MIFVLVFAIILYSIDAYNIYKWTKFVKSNSLPQYFYKLAWVISIIMLISLIILVYLRSFDPVLASEIGIIHNFASVWYLPKIFITPFLIIYDIINSLKKFLVHLNQPQQFQKEQELKKEQILDSRRKFTKNLSLTVSSVPFIIVSKGAFDSVTNPLVHKVDIPIKNLPSEFDQFTIVQISDVHVGSFRSDKMFREVIEIVNGLKPDIFVNTGDFVNFNPDELNLFSNHWYGFKPKIGMYSCLGNHDHYMSDDEHSKLVDNLKILKQNLLMNEHQYIEKAGKKLIIAGIDNYGFGQSYGDFDKAFSGIEEDSPVIFLCHDPTNWDTQIRNKRKVDLMLSGHTHGGQIGVTIRGKEYSPVSLKYAQWAGLYKDNEQYLYVNRGLGTSGFPVRIGMNPEITYFKLHKA